MSDVAIFYADVSAVATSFSGAAINLQPDISYLSGGDPGVEAPVGRNQLKAEFSRQMDQLHDAVFAHWEATSALASSAFAITAKYSELDEELSGEANP